MRLLIAGLALFLGIHVLPMFPSLRAALLARWGEPRYKGVFSVVSAVGLVLIVAGYAVADDRTRLFAPFPAARALAPFAMVASFILFAAANMRGHLRRIVRHPMLLGLLLWASVHLLANGDRAGPLRRLPRLCDRRSCFGRPARRGQGIRPGAKARPDRRCRRCRRRARGHDLPSDPVRRSGGPLRRIVAGENPHTAR